MLPISLSIYLTKFQIFTHSEISPYNFESRAQEWDFLMIYSCKREFETNSQP